MSKCKNCVYCSSSQKWCTKFVIPVDPEHETDCAYHKVKTVAESIRNMTDDEMAQWLSNVIDGWGCPVKNGCKTSIEDCDTRIRGWLQQEVGG